MAGVHGANRLGGNSLAETVAYGVVAGRRIADRADGPGSVPDALRERLVEPHLRDLRETAASDGAHEPSAVLADLRELMWDHAGILRDEASLRAGLDRLDAVRERAADLRVGPVTSESFELAIDLGFSLVAAEAVLRGALAREESRGAHYRTDFPDRDPDWRRNVYVEAADVGGMTLRTAPVDEPSEAVQAALDEGHELDYHQLE
jgi:succinate dehydrogenase / fumarate reductase flavoprotein subunit